MFLCYILIAFICAKVEASSPKGKYDNVLNIFPYFAGYVKVGNSLITNSRETCFQDTNFTVKKTGEYYHMSIQFKNPLSHWCNDGYLVASLNELHIHYQYIQGTHDIYFKVPTDKAANADISYMGFRVFKFQEGPVHTLEDVMGAFNLFFGAMIGKGVPDWEAENNLGFLKDKMNYTMEPRKVNLVNITKTDIHSGDMLGIIRLDGIDPLLAYLMGSQTGHTAITMWDKGELYVCESTVKSNYWPTGGVQRTKWDIWIRQGLLADYNVVHLPLNEKTRSNFNVSEALKFFQQTEGLAYGYPNMMFSLIDTPSSNLPFPASIELGQILVPFIMEKLDVNYYSDILRQGLNNRIFNTTLVNLTTWECYIEMYIQNKTIQDYIIMPELDEWEYHLEDVRTSTIRSGPSTIRSGPSTIRSGPSMVCDVFVCRMWKAGGIFGDISLNCAEFTNLDVYSLDIFDVTTPREKECTEADPTLEYCQIMGSYRMHLHHYNEYSPFNNMRENCPSVPPKYIRSPKC
jgi:hypothetical protein